jgi:ADP-ribose pyrophosphatase YjhB (NUDIX family)
MLVNRPKERPMAKITMDIIALLDEVQATARTGLHFTEGAYDKERYTRLLELVTQSYSDWLDLPAESIQARFAAELGYVTPKVGADAAIFNEQGEILLMERADGSGWCLPCGWVEAHEKPVNAVVREVREETGLEVQVKRLVGVFTRLADARHGPHTMIAVVHLCEIVGGELTLSHEGLSLRYWPVEAVPNWHPIHDKYARVAHEMWQAGDRFTAVSD